MIRPICRDVFILGRKSEPATTKDIAVVADLVDTLEAYREECVGMAANMIGVNKQIIAFCVGPLIVSMLNPVILRGRDRYETEEGCVSLAGIRKAVRWREIQIKYQDAAFKTREETYSGITAQIIQHEIDHINGILI